MTDKRVDEPTGTEFVGHEWDGIEELDTPLPRWWLWALYATIVWGVAFTIFYPAWPLIESATSGTLGWSSRGELEAELAEVEAQRAPTYEALSNIPVEDLPRSPQLMQTAVEGGRAAFRVHCVQCHGSGAAGSPGYPNLNDDDWLWGGDMQSIEYTIIHGIRNPDHDETRTSQMPAFGRDGMLTSAEINDLTAFIRVISEQDAASRSSARGAELFAINCASCHGSTGEGDRSTGSPRLTDPIWLYGGDSSAIRTTIANSRNGVMPRWGHRLDPATIRMLTAYVYSLGGGEDMRIEAENPEAGVDERP